MDWKQITEKGLVELKMTLRPGLYQMAVLDALQKATAESMDLGFETDGDFD